MTEPDQIQRIRLIYERLVQGDLPGTLEFADPDPEYHNPSHAMEAGTRRGSEEFAQAIQNITENFQFTSLEIQRWAVRGDSEALVEVRTIGTGTHSGAPVNQLFGQHYVFQNGLVLRLEWFSDWDTAAAKAGLDPGTWQQSG